MKLVRDKIPEIMKSQNKQSTYHMANDEEYAKLLKEKLKEETEEYIDGEKCEELADIFEVILALCKKHNITFEQLNRIREAKKMAKGGFERGLVLDTWQEN